MIDSLLIYSRAGATNLFAIAGHFVSYCWVSGPHNFLVILWNLLKTKKFVHQQKQTTNKSNQNLRNSTSLSGSDIALQRLEAGQRKFKTAGLAWMLRRPHEIILWAPCGPCSSPLFQSITVMGCCLQKLHVNVWNKSLTVKVIHCHFICIVLASVFFTTYKKESIYFFNCKNIFVIVKSWRKQVY